MSPFRKPVEGDDAWAQAVLRSYVGVEAAGPVEGATERLEDFTRAMFNRTFDRLSWTDAKRKWAQKQRSGGHLHKEKSDGSPQLAD